MTADANADAPVPATASDEASALTQDELVRLPTVNVIADPLRVFQDGATWWWVGVGGSTGDRPFFVKAAAPDQRAPRRRPRP